MGSALEMRPRINEGLMRVLHVIPSVSEKAGGPSQAIFPMCRTLQKLGIDVTLATTNHEMDRHQNGSDHVMFKGVPTYFFQTNSSNSFKYSRPCAEWLNRNVTHFDLVHIHAVFNHSSVAAARACRKNHVPYVVRPLGSLDSWGMNQKRFRKRIFWQIAGKAMCQGSAAMHYTAIQEKKSSEECFGLNHGTVIPLGIEEIDRGPQDASDGDLGITRPYILVLARLVPTKGIDVLLRAFLSLVIDPAFEDWSLVIAGDGPVDYINELKNLARAAPSRSSVVFTGWLDGTLKYRVLSDASLLALPSEHENFGLCVIEALACGVPVLISPQVGLSNEVSTREAGWVVAVDHGSIVTVLREALGNRKLLAKKGVAGKELAREFTWDVVGRQLEMLYQSIVGTSNHRRV